MKRATGRFIAIEGFDGVGKSTVIAGLRKAFPGAVFIKEPGTTAFGRHLRKILKGGKYGLSHWSEKLLFASSMVETTEKVIRPALARGKLVIADRWYQSTFAYQFCGYGVDYGWFEAMYKRLGVAAPDWVFILSLPFEECLKRQGNAGRGKKDKFESQNKAYLRKVHAYYADLAKTYEDPALLGRSFDAGVPKSDLLKDVVRFTRWVDLGK